ncbi:MAG TPA: hypothetical protein VGA56_22580 [Opitutaceae bacterium]
MKTYVYLSLIPEALIASNLPPNEFGVYFSTGTRKRSRGQAIFFEVDPHFSSAYLPVAEYEQRCAPRQAGVPRRSAYLSIYRVLEHVPVAQLGRLHLATDDGRVLALDRGEFTPEPSRTYHLYQEFCPVNPRVASVLGPREFCQRITDRNEPVSVDRIVFADLRLEALGRDPDANNVDNLPYFNIEHLRDCLRELAHKGDKPTKTVIRQLAGEVLFRTIRRGFYVGDQKEFAFYPMPTREALEAQHHLWWRSALNTFGG